jgi:hypothetical protein
MPEGAIFLNIEPLESLAMKFSTLWYMNEMSKQWKSNALFHAYYQQLKVTIGSFSCMTPRTLHQYRLLAKFHADPHFIYIIAHKYERKEELQSYYKLTDKYMKEWLEEFHVPVDDAKLSDSDIIGSPLVIGFEHAG